MAEQNRAFDEVRAILGKLDRSIDAARDRRLHGDRQPVRPQPERPAEPPAAEASPPEHPQGPSPVSPQRPGNSKYGKAKPLRQPPEHPGNGSAQWRSA